MKFVPENEPVTGNPVGRLVSSVEDHWHHIVGGANSTKKGAWHVVPGKCDPPTGPGHPIDPEQTEDGKLTVSKLQFGVHATARVFGQLDSFHFIIPYVAAVDSAFPGSVGE